MTTAVLLAFSDGSKEFIDGTHVHGFSDGHLLIASGAPGAGLDAEVVRRVATAGLNFAETCEREDTSDDRDSASSSGWSASWPDA